MIKKVSCIIIDDEPYARKGLQGYIEKTAFLQLAGICENGLQLRPMLEGGKPDLLFLDIEMPYINGVDLIRELTDPPKVIFTTAYEQYAIESYELDVMDYLLKPISYERFLRAAEKALDYFQFREATVSADFIFVKSGGRLEKVLFSELLYVEGMENYLALYLTGKKLIIHSTIKAFLEKLPAQQFLQTHKSYIVSTGKVTAVEGNMLYVGGGQVPVSRGLMNMVMKKIIPGV